MSKTMTKTMKYKIAFNKETYNILNDIKHISFRIKNLATTMAYDWQSYSFSFHERYGKYPKEKEVLGKVLLTDINQNIKEKHPEFLFASSSIIEGSAREAVSYFNTWKKDILSGRMAIPSYRLDGSFPLRAKSIRNLSEIKTGLYSGKLSLLSRDAVKKMGLKSGQIEVELIGSRKNNSINSIMNNIISGEYKLSDSRIQSDKKGNYYLLVAYTFEKKEVILDENKVMGVDLGIAVPATISVNDDNYYYQFVGSAQEIREFERQVANRRVRISRSRKWAGEGTSGRGRNTRVKAVDRIGNKISNFKDTKNHQWSKFIVDEAVRLGVSRIQMEDLTGISSNANKDNDLFLKRWTFYDLQNKIAYKANEYGIEVVLVSPKYTSARCSSCGYIHIDEPKEEWRPNQETFKCTKCNHGHSRRVNADINASRNISVKDIDQVIAADLKSREETLNKLEQLKNK